MNSSRSCSEKALSRRSVLRAAAAAALGTPFVLPSGVRAASPNAKLCHACIGVTRRGEIDLKALQAHPRLQIVALCDVDTQHLDTAAKLVPGARLYTDWRELYEKEGDKIDSVNITTPDHMHFPMAYAAVRRGKHIYCQKPMCHDVAEVRAITEAATKKGIVTQVGTQASSGIGDRMTVQLLQGGVIGKIKHVYLCSNNPNTPNRIKGPRPAQGETPPPYLNWDLWIGTAPMRPYAPGIYHPAAWRGWFDFGTSWCADMGTHILDATWKALHLKAPASVVAEVEESWKNSPERRRENWPQSEHVTWMFPGNEMTEGEVLPVEWFDGAMLPPQEVRDLYPGKYPISAALLVGTEGALLQSYDTKPWLLPATKFKDYPRPTLPPRDHYLHYVDACLGGEKTESSFAQAGPMNEAILLGTVAIRYFGQELTWDAAAMHIPNFPEAERYLKRTYREGWQVG